MYVMVGNKFYVPRS